MVLKTCAKNIMRLLAMQSKYKQISFKGNQITFRKSAGSHIPLLRSIGTKFPIRTVIEFGTGMFSLKTFLDKEYFPLLENIYSYETSNLWIEYMKSLFDDQRWTIESIKGVKGVNYPCPVDLVFVDGVDDQRISVLNDLKHLSSIFVLHDSEIELFEKPQATFKYRFEYVPPEFRHTSILSDSVDVSKVKWDVKWDNDFVNWI